MKTTPSATQNILTLLGETPQRIAVSAAGIESAVLARPLAPKTWSAVQILAHLRACSELWGLSIYAMLGENEPSLSFPHPRHWVRGTGYERLEFHASLQVFTQQRSELLAVLRPLPAAAWERACQIDGRRHTIFSQARRLALHEGEHCIQIETLLGEIP